MIREYREGDEDALRRCIVALQDFERTLDPRLLPGESMAQAYGAHMHERCRNSSGRIFVAECDGEVCGFVTILGREPFTELDEPPGHYALISDLAVLEPHRGKGIGRQLLKHAEAFAREQGAADLRIGVLAGNSAALRLYRDEGFVPHLMILSKKL